MTVHLAEEPHIPGRGDVTCSRCDRPLVGVKIWKVANTDPDDHFPFRFCPRCHKPELHRLLDVLVPHDLDKCWDQGYVRSVLGVADDR